MEAKIMYFDKFNYQVGDVYDVTYEDDDMLHIHADMFLLIGDINKYENFKIMGDNGGKPTKIIKFDYHNKRDGEILEGGK